MIQSIARLGTSLKALGVCIAFVVSAAYVFFAYHQTSADLQSKSQALFLQDQKDVDKAFQQFRRFLSLTEARLLNSAQRKERIVPILSVRTERLIDGPFPDVVSLMFVPASHPTTVYSRFGEAQLERPVGLEQNGFKRFGDGAFTFHKTLLDTKQKAFGALQATFSIGRLLYKNFAENEISVHREKSLTGGEPSFTVEGFPYVFALNREPLSFLRFLLAYKFQVLSTLVFGAVLLIAGMAAGLSFQKNLLIRRLALNRKLKEKLRALEEGKDRLTARLTSCQHLLKLKGNASKETNLLFEALEGRYRQMAGQAHAINLLTSKLISQETANDRLMKEIHSISQESNTILRKLVNGYPMRGMEDGIDVADCLNRIKSIFLPEITKKNVAVELKGSIKAYIPIDRLAFELVLYSVFHLIIDRFIKNNRLKIVLKDEGAFQINFYDDGCDVEERLRKISAKPSRDGVLCLDKKRLREFTGYLGWEVSFQNDGILSNSIKLSIPRVLNESAFPANVVNMFDFKPHAQ